MLLQTDGSGHAGEGYRFAVKSERLSATIWSRDILDSPDLAGYQLNYELRGEEIELRPNSLVSQWTDLDVLVGKGKIVVLEPGGAEPLNEQFRALWSAAKKKQVRLGASVRWAVQANPRGDLKLVLQGLPAEAQSLQAEPRLTADDCDTVHLDAFETNVDWNEDGPCRGPVPVLFARDPAAVKTALSAHPERVHAGLRAVVGSIPCTKRLHLDEAWQRARNPPETSAVYPLRPVDEPVAGPSRGVQPDTDARAGVPNPRAGAAAVAREVPPATMTADQTFVDQPAERKKSAGKFAPKDEESVRKYGIKNLPKIVISFLKPVSVKVWNKNIRKQSWKLLSRALARGTWLRYGSALKAWKRFMEYRGSSWKTLNGRDRAAFICWCGEKENLKAGTVKTYLGALKSLRNLRKEIHEGGGNF